MSWLIESMINQLEFQRLVLGIFCPWDHRGPTPWATLSDQMSMASIPSPQYRLVTKNGILNFSGLIHKNGKETNQKTTNPRNWLVVVGMDPGSVFFIV